jgi:hypothetical protein
MSPNLEPDPVGQTARQLPSARVAGKGLAGDQAGSCSGLGLVEPCSVRAEQARPTSRWRVAVFLMILTGIGQRARLRRDGVDDDPGGGRRPVSTAVVAPRLTRIAVSAGTPRSVLLLLGAGGRLTRVVLEGETRDQRLKMTRFPQPGRYATWEPYRQTIDTTGGVMVAERPS